MLNTKLIAVLFFAALATVTVACGSDRPASGATPTPTPATTTQTPVVPTPTTPVPNPQPSQSEVQKLLDSVVSRWNANRPTNYQFLFDRICFCPQVDPILVTVNGGEIVSSTGQNNGAPTIQPLTVDQLFDRIQQALDSKDSRILGLEFERDLGYPIEVSIDQIVGAIDDEVSYKITQFQVLPDEIDITQLRRDLDAATFRWFESGPQSYEFVFHWECFCPAESRLPVRVRVEGGQIVSTVDAVTGAAVVAPGGLEYLTVLDLFGWISERLNRDPEFAALEFDTETGYPVNARFNPILLLSDDEEAFFIQELTQIDTHVALQENLNEARARWDLMAPDYYTYRFNWSCFCIQDFTAAMTVTVELGEVTKVIRVEDGQPVSEEFRDDFVTVDALFDRVQDAIDQGAASIRAKFDPESGLPTEVFIDFQAIMADEELGWNASDVTLLK